MHKPTTNHPIHPRPVAALDGDGPAMRDAIDALNAAGVRFTRQTEHHLKIGPWNYYPTRGTLYHDATSHNVMRDVDLDALIDQIGTPERRQNGRPKRPL